MDLGGSIIGLKQSEKAVESGKAKMAIVARDADAHVREPFLNKCRQFGVPVQFVSSCRELGNACGIDVGAAVAVLTKD
jgi:large subunit ribosomal protein L7A